MMSLSKYGSTVLNSLRFITEINVLLEWFYHFEEVIRDRTEFGASTTSSIIISEYSPTARGDQKLYEWNFNFSQICISLFPDLFASSAIIRLLEQTPLTL